jgi:hypothetical protein
VLGSGQSEEAESKKALERKKRAAKIVLLGSSPLCTASIYSGAENFHCRPIRIREGQTCFTLSLQLAETIL